MFAYNSLLHVIAVAIVVTSDHALYIDRHTGHVSHRHHTAGSMGIFRTKRRTAAVVGVHGHISSNVGLVGAVPCYTEVDRTARQAAVFQPDQQLVYCHPAGCVLPSAQQHHQLALW